MNAQKTVVLPSGFGSSYGELRPAPVVPPGESSVFAIQPYVDIRVDSVHVYGRKGARLRAVSIDLPEAETLTDLAPDIASSALFSTNVAKRLDAHLRTVRTGGIVAVTIQNEGRSHERASVVAQGFCSVGIVFDSGTLCGLLAQIGPKAPSVHRIGLGETVSETTLLPFTTALVKVRVKTDAPQGSLVATCLQLANSNLLIGAEVPIEVFTQGGAPISSAPCKAGTRLSLTIERRVFPGAHEGEVTFSIEYEVLARGECDPRRTLGSEN